MIHGTDVPDRRPPEVVHEPGTCEKYLQFVSGSIEVHDCTERIRLFRHAIECTLCREKLVDLWVSKHQDQPPPSENAPPPNG
jgi:hypothetical protein